MKQFRRLIVPLLASSTLIGLALPARADINLADSPLFSAVSVPGNLALVLSVEYPTAISPSYPSTSAYVPTTEFLGYFDPNKCYTYSYNSTTPANSYFSPYGAASTHACSSSAAAPLWSGNYLNWASMQTLDTFRWVLTGGTRMTDDVGTTILEKTNNSGQGTHSSNTPDKTVSTASYISGATPFTWGSITTRDWGGQTAMWITGTQTSTLANNSNITSTDYQGQNSYVTSTSSSYADNTAIYKIYIRVKVCDPSVGVEDNCTAYSSTNYKPEGLIQKYASKLRFSAFGYLNDWGVYKDGGVLRARMNFVGPTQPVPGSADITNTAAEWSSTTGQFVQNPDSSDATDTTNATGVTISNSGVINYLNKFGKIVTITGYKKYDPVSELYYTATRYFRNLGNVTAYSSLTTNIDNSSTNAERLDGFPVITTWDDPIKYYCQKNFILGIGDVNTNYDGDLYGSSLTTGSPSVAPSDDTTINVVTATSKVGTMEGINNLSSTKRSNGTYYIAGLAYYIHTNDIRSDLTDSQTVSTYWLDVLEYQTYVAKNQYWLATKYGGFTVPSGYSYATNTTAPATNTWHTSTDYVGTNGASTNLRPDNYYTADRADTMKSGLTAAFSKIVSEAAAATSTALSSPSAVQTSSGNINYAANYNPSDWTGYVKAQTVTYDASGNPNYTDVWNAQTLLDSLTYTSRLIVTCCTSTGTALPFQATSLSSATLSSRTYYTSFASVPGVSSASQSAANYVAYLHGDRTKEVANGGAYRTRTHLLGDIVDSGVVAVGVPAAGYADQYNPAYSTFKNTYASRKTVAYVGANDGMLHAFDGSSTGTTAGQELFAYIPSFVYGTASTASTTGISSLGNPSFTHHYFVDATPVARDVDFYRTDSPTATTNDWHTILVGGLGKGGKGYYAIDITNPTTWTTETAVAGKVLWEFTNSHMGYSYGSPLIIKTAKYGWVVVLASGYNNDDGKAYFFFLNPRTGALLETVATSTGTTAAPLNMAHITAFIPSSANFQADAIYGGDLQGNIWRLDLTGTSGSYSVPTKIASLTNSSGTAEPVTTRPLVEADTDTSRRYVLVGTGRLLADSDISSTSQQTFYAIRDGSNTYGSFYTSSTLPSGATFPVTRTQLQTVSSLLTGMSSTSSSSTVMGYYYDLTTDSSTGIASRISIQPSFNAGVVAFATTLPSGSACSPSGTSTIYALSMTSGKSVLVDNSGNIVASVASSASVRNLTFYSVSGTTRLLAGTSSGTVTKVSGNFNSAGTLKRLNWRVIPVVE